MSLGKWKTKEGLLIDISEMSDSHLTNSLKYCYKRADFISLRVLKEEHKRRWFLETKECPYCKDSMVKNERFDIEDHWFPHTRWLCTGCGSTSNKIPNYSEPQLNEDSP